MAKIEFQGFGGTVLHGFDYGNREDPAVLLLHGVMQTRSVWHESAQELARAGRYVVCIDLRGHGDSQQDVGSYTLDAYIGDIKAVLAGFSSRPTIIGSTIGGWVSLIALGEANTPLATGVVITNPPSSIPQEEISEAKSALIHLAAQLESKTAFNNDVTKVIYDFESLQSRLNSAVSNITIPTLIVRGADSKISSTEHTKQLADSIPDVQIKEIEGAGHHVAFEKFDEFNATILEFLERKIPRTSPEYISGSDIRTLRDSMGCFATGVTVVTCKDSSGNPVGLTANSFTSVSLEPPLVLVCLAKNAGSLQAFSDADSFAINVLHIGQQPTSNLFASKGQDRFAVTDWEVWDQDSPIIQNSLANFECIKTSEIEQGDHIILIGEVQRAKFEPRKDPLLYFGGKYRRLHFQ